ncbi:MAG: hydroxypyruvate isomerase [Planctomycetes bacterium RBG_13_44_8b]|nr:MAG: hydroxypyruvate isomerase [Planctomycetes bacterium RBG_13_44_8b]
MDNKFPRRTFLRNSSIAAAGAIAGVLDGKAPALGIAEVERMVKNGRINQAVSRWCYGKLSLDELCQVCNKIGIKGIDLLDPKDFPTVKKHGLVCTMINTHGLTKGINTTENHAECLAKIRSAIDAAAEYGYPNVISFPGNRAGMSDEDGIKNSVTALKQIISYAEEKKVTICLEYLNSKVDHKNYMFDNMKWGVEVCKAVGSQRVKILYDIYHAQIMEGDIIRTIRTYKDYIGHYHTGGNPGRNEIDETQELYYPAIMRAIVETGFTGYVAHEFVPKREPLESLSNAVRICDV